jgi:hypothetical protein
MNDRLLRSLLLGLLLAVVVAGTAIAGTILARDWWASQVAALRRDQEELTTLQGVTGDPDVLEERVAQLHAEREAVQEASPPTEIEVNRVVTSLAGQHGVVLSRVSPGQTAEGSFVEFEATGAITDVVGVIESLYRNHPSFEPVLLTVNSGPAHARLVLRVRYE